MNGLKKPRQVRWPKHVDTMRTAKMRATRLTAAERADVLKPMLDSFTALRQGIATEWHWTQVASAICVALAIDEQGIVRGLRAHLVAADVALLAIAERAKPDMDGAWKPTSLHYHELDAISCAIDLHKYQLEQLAACEFHRAVAAAKAQILKDGGKVYAALGARA